MVAGVGWPVGVVDVCFAGRLSGSSKKSHMVPKSQAICMIMISTHFQSARNGPINVIRFTTDMIDLPTVNVGVLADILKGRRGSRGSTQYGRSQLYM